MSERDQAIYAAFKSQRTTDAALELWDHAQIQCPHWSLRQRLAHILPILAESVLTDVLAHDPSRRDAPSEERNALERIVSWSEAYPLDIFPEPDLKRVHELLAAGGITLDAVSAHCMRHALSGVGQMAREAARDPNRRDAPSEERERCAREIEAIAINIRDHGPMSREGLLTATAGAQVGALFDAAASLRSKRYDNVT